MRILLPAIVVVSALVLACSDNGQDGASAPAVPTRTPLVATAVPPLELSTPVDVAGWLVHVYNGAIYVGALDGNNQLRLELPGMAPEKAGYAGTAAVDGVRWLYFAAQLTHTATGTDFPVGEYALVRVRAGERDAAEVTRFTTLSGAGSGHGAASISSDGRRMLYRSLDGIVLRDLTTGVEEVLFDGTCAEAPETKCESFSWPQWSPTGDTMIARHHRYEISSAAVAQPVSASGALPLLDYGGEAQAWAPDGADVLHLFDCVRAGRAVACRCEYVGRRGSGSTLLSEHTTRAVPPCGWRCRGGSVQTGGRRGLRLSHCHCRSCYGRRTVGNGHAAGLLARGGMAAGRFGLIVSKSNNCTPCRADEPLVAAVTFDGVMHALPFEVATASTSERDTSFVLAVVAP